VVNFFACQTAVVHFFQMLRVGLKSMQKSMLVYLHLQYSQTGNIVMNIGDSVGHDLGKLACI
jgi:hypothetical protein